MRFIAIFNADASTLKSIDLDALGKKVSATFAAAGHDVSVEIPEGSALKKAIQKALKATDIASAVYYPQPLHLAQPLADLGYRPGDFPLSEQACRQTLAIPIYPEMSEDQIERVTGQLIAVC